MTPQAALQILGLNAPADAAAVRASYLKLLRVTKPEQKPEEFRALREAYELLKSGFGEPPALSQPGAQGPNEDHPGEVVGDDAERSLQVVVATGDETDAFLQRIDAQPRGIERIRALDRIVASRPTDTRLLLRLFEELLDAGIWDVAGGVLGDLRKTDPQLWWRLLVRRLGARAKARELKEPPPGAAPEDRLEALRLLIDEHHQIGEAACLAAQLCSELDDATAERFEQDLITMALRAGASGFVEAGQLLLRAVLRRTAADGRPELVEWARLSGSQHMLLSAMATALYCDDPSLVRDAAERLAEPAHERTLLAEVAPALFRRFGEEIPSVRVRPKQRRGRPPQPKQATADLSGRVLRPRWFLVLAAVIGIGMALLHRFCPAL